MSLCLHSNIYKEVLMGQKSGDWMCSDCKDVMNRQLYKRGTPEEYWEKRLKDLEKFVSSKANIIDKNCTSDEKRLIFEVNVAPYEIEAMNTLREEVKSAANRFNFFDESGTCNDGSFVMKFKISES